MHEGNRQVDVMAVREAVLSLEGEGVDVGPPTMRYTYLMGNARFCLVPRGRGWWTVRLFEAMFAGCLPVLLSDRYRLPAAVPWDDFLIRWPSDRIDASLVAHLRAMPDDELLRRRQAMDDALCHVDYHDPTAACSPFVDALRALHARSLDVR